MDQSLFKTFNGKGSMFFITVGISHKRSSVEVREKLFLNSLEQELLLSCLKKESIVREAFIIATCNRTEIYAHLTKDNPALLIESLFRMKEIPSSQGLSRHFYIKKGREVVSHLFHVACGLDSLVIGEKQILGQVKNSMVLAGREGMIDTVFNILIHTAIRTAKKAQTQTHISLGGSSVSWAAVATAQKLLGSLEGKNVLIIGAGKMSQLAAGDFQRKRAGKLFIMNRTQNRGEDLVRKFNGELVDFGQIRTILREVDVCFCSTGASYYLIDKGLIESVMTKNPRKLLMIDVSMPRNIHPDVGSVKGVTLMCLDDLDKIVEQNIEQRLKAVCDVKEIIAQKTDEFFKKLKRNPHLPDIFFREWADDPCQAKGTRDMTTLRAI